MPRIRTIKPEFWSSPSVAGADPWVRLLFIAMWNWADDTGRGTANVKELAAFAFPHDEDPGAPTAAELPSLLTEIRGRFDVLFYEVGGRRYYAIPTWDKHQRNERRAKSKYPAPEEGTGCDPTPPGQGKPDSYSRVTEVPPHSHGSSVALDGRSGAGTGEQGNRGTETKTSSSSSPRKRGTRIPDDFTVTPDMVTWARDRTPTIDGRRETEKFINYWRAATGQKATKRDWDATWRNWMLTAAERAPQAGINGHRPSTTDQRVADAQALKARFATTGSNVLQLPSGDPR